MPFSAQKLFPLKHSVLWKLSFEQFSNCLLSTFLSNQHFLMFFPTLMRCFALVLQKRHVNHVVEFRQEFSVHAIAYVSTLYLKWYLIISELQSTPWPRPANAHIGVL